MFKILSSLQETQCVLCNIGKRQYFERYNFLMEGGLGEGVAISTTLPFYTSEASSLNFL